MEREDDVRGTEVREGDEYAGVDTLALGLGGNTDAQVWARAFVEQFEGQLIGNRAGEMVDTDTMLGWFANAIMSGHDSATIREQTRAQVAFRLRLAQHDADRHLENVLSWLGRRLPRSVRYWTTLGVLAEATTRELADFEVPGITIEQLLPVIARIGGRS